MLFIRKYYLLIVPLMLLFLHGCTMFDPPFGVWVCEDLRITVDFNDNDIHWASITGKGVIIANGEEIEIVCGMDPLGNGNILLLSEIENRSAEREFLFIGKYINVRKGEMIFKVKFSDEQFTFVKVPE